jgi:hypothetical protein
VLYLMSYGHHHEVLKVGRGREIRTPDILLPKQARYQTALYPDFINLALAPTPDFRRPHHTHPHGERQRQNNDFTTVSALGLFHFDKLPCDNTQLFRDWINRHDRPRI